MNKVEREYFFKYIATVYSENGLCENCPMRAECSKIDGSVEHCYDVVLKALKASTTPKISSETWVDEMTDLQIRERKTDWAHYEVRDKKGVVITTVVFDMKNAVKRATATCRRKDFNSRVGIAIAYARLRGLPIHEDFATKHDIVL